jgi:hypothetical protein
MYLLKIIRLISLFILNAYFAVDISLTWFHIIIYKVHIFVLVVHGSSIAVIFKIIVENVYSIYLRRV